MCIKKEKSKIYFVIYVYATAAKKKDMDLYTVTCKISPNIVD